MSRPTDFFPADAFASSHVKFLSQSIKKKWGSDITKELIIFPQFWEVREEEIDFWTFQIIKHFALKNKKLTFWVAKQNRIISFGWIDEE